jgi:hypothetical protein
MQETLQTHESWIHARERAVRMSALAFEHQQMVLITQSLCEDYISVPVSTTLCKRKLNSDTVWVKRSDI